MALRKDYPWLTPAAPAVISSPMMKICMSKLTVETTLAGGLAFLAAGFDVSNLAKDLAECAELFQKASFTLSDNNSLPIGVGFQNWGADLQVTLKALQQHPVAAVWFFGPKKLKDYAKWTESIREISNNKTKIWIQVGTVAEALEVVRLCRPDVLVVQGADSGGHGLRQRAGIITLLPEIADALRRKGIHIPLVAAGGIIDGRYRDEILRVVDGGVATAPSTIYDKARGITGWPETYVGRGVTNKTYHDAARGRNENVIKALHDEALEKSGGTKGWGPRGRLTTYAGTGVGLVREVKSAREIVQEIQRDASYILGRRAADYDATRGRPSGDGLRSKL
ncbi:Nitronate monooxygenase [Cyphellophora attinorum]|uniref:Nitronate monooxygenase n=1 Tax=Cyphellophora attinorum TaxID=1664694 RepID=A0A0N0NI19_9EURO|nr:Nitronate monooxygenase [Phialophora attinorum]KPI35331.1 Nitronate monooxygenase [Phialophora attinorum]